MSDREIRAAVQSGVLDAEGLAAVCGAGNRCGGCSTVVESLLAESSVTIARSAA